MKILFICTSIGYGGAEKNMVVLANHFSKNHDVTFLTYRSPEILQPLSDRVKHVHDELNAHNNKFVSIYCQVRALRKYIKQNKFDLGISFINPASYILTLASKGTDMKVLLSERGDPNEFFASEKWYDKFVYKIVQHADAYVFQTENAAKCYSKKAQKKSTVIANPMPNKVIPEPHCGEREHVIVTASRMDLYQKRQDVLIEAFAKIAAKYPDYILRLYGDGPDMEQIKEYAACSGVGERIDFMGLSRNVLNDIKSSAMFVLSSDFEGIPNALLEAMACGIPCISTDCSPGGARVIINDGENGFVVPCGDTNALADAMDRLLSDNELSEKFSIEAVKVTETFAKERIFSMWEDFIHKVNNYKR